MLRLLILLITLLFFTTAKAEQVSPLHGLETYYYVQLSGSETEEVIGATSHQDAIDYLCMRLEQRNDPEIMIFISCGSETVPHPSNPDNIQVLVYSCPNDSRDCSNPERWWSNWYGAIKSQRDYWYCPESHPAHIDRNSDGRVDSLDWCERITICDCTETLVTATNQCQARTVTWNGNALTNIISGSLIETSDANNQDRQCGRVTIDSSCSPENPIQNKDEIGNPISCASGQKIQSELDYQSSVGNLSFSRTYIQEPEQVESGMENLVFDRSALPSNIQMIYKYDARMAAEHYNFWSPNVPLLEKSGSSISAFTNGRGGQKIFLDNAAFRPQQGTLSENSGTTIHTTIGGTEYHFNSDNKLIKKVYRNGQFQDYTYPNANQLVIADNFGRSLTIDYVTLNLPFYGSKQFVSKLTDPAGNEYLYEYDNLGQLTKVIYPDNTPGDATDNPFKLYGYQDLGNNHQGLTSITDELGSGFASWTYDSYRRATLSEHSGSAEKVTIDYTNPISEVASSSVKHYRDDTNYTETLYDFKKLNGSYKPLKISTQPCPDCSVGETNYEYDSEGYLSQITHPDGTITQYQYNNRGLQESRTEAFGTAEARTITTTWHASYNLPLSMDEPQRLTTYSYDANGNLLARSVQDKATSETRTVSYTYNSVGQVLTVDGARTHVNDITTYEYDASGNGNLVKITNALGHETNIMAHDAHGKPLSVTDPNGTVTSMTYHPRGWLTSISTDGDTTSYAYDKAGQLTSVTMANGVVLSYEYDAAQRLTAIVDAQGNRIEYTLDYMGNRTRTDIKDSSGTIKSFATAVFNDLGRLKETLGANNQSNKVNYDAEGYPTDTIDALNNSSSNQYDALDRLTKAVDPDLGETNFGYDTHDRLTSVTDATNKTTSYAYNAFGEVTSQTSPDTGISSFTYDSAGNLLTATDARNITATYAYDALNRVTSISYPNASENVSFNYDSTASNNQGIGRLTSISDESGSTSYQYDTKGQLVQETRVINGVSFITAYAYDAAGLLTQVIYPSGRTVDYVRNNLGQVISVSTTANGQTQTLASNISYLPFGPMESLTYGNGKVLTQSFDQDYRLTNKAVSGISDLGYGYTPRNNINNIVDSFDSNFDQSFSYDNLARLTDASGEYGDQDYSFDAIGNRLSKTQDGSTENYQYDPASHQLTQVGNTNLTYDASGNTLTKGDLTFAYNQMGRMVTANKVDMSASYQYNTQGERVKKTVNGEVTLYHYDQADQLIAQSDGSGNVIQEFVYLDGMRLVAITKQALSTITLDEEQANLLGDWSAVSKSSLYNSDGEIASKLNKRRSNFSSATWSANLETGTYEVYVRWFEARKHASNASYKVSHVNGNSNVIMSHREGSNTWHLLGIYDFSGAAAVDINNDADGSVVADAVMFKPMPSRIYYIHNDHIGTPIALTDTFGVTQWKSSHDPYGNLNIEINNVNQVFGFPGQINDTETDLFYNYFRDYDPELGRYLQSDPIGLDGGINTYAYVGANPINYYDPFGLEGVGHHWFPRHIWKNTVPKGDAFTIFNQTTSGKYTWGKHQNSWSHARYNEGVRALWDDYLKANKINARKCTGPQALKFLDLIDSSNDWRVRDFKQEVEGMSGTKMKDSIQGRRDIFEKRQRNRRMKNLSKSILKGFGPALGPLMEATKPSPERACDMGADEMCIN